MDGESFASNALGEVRKSRLHFLHSWISEGTISQMVFWGLLPFASLLATLVVASLHFSSQFPLFLGIVSGCALLSFQTRLSGFFASLALLTLTLFFQLKQGAMEETLWYSGIYLASILNTTLFHLARKEIGATIAPLLGRLSEKGQLLERLEHTFGVAQEEWRRKEESFEDTRESAEREISHLLVKLDAQAKKMALVEEEIELLTSQKEEILSRAIAQVPVTVPIVEESLPNPDLLKECAALRGRNEQFCLQFEEKKELLAEVRKELFLAQEKGERLEKEAFFASLEPESEELKGWQEESLLRGEEILSLTEEITTLEELVSRVHPQ
ncbi:MAG: hypothetical protein K940chlam9_00951 [Chlamydiae bacterium]|nr:hypothetical protein [Chlamydiota bacterium]